MIMPAQRRPATWWWFLALLPIIGLVLSCALDSQLGSGTTRWACPSPVPQPYGEGGPIKRQWQACETDPLTGAQVNCRDRFEYYEIWEQEYGHLGGPPFPEPTPYGFTGSSFVFGQRAEVPPVHAQLTARAGRVISTTQQLYLVDMTWNNPTSNAIPFDYLRQVGLRAITKPDGAVVTDGRWGSSHRALTEHGVPTLPVEIPPGESTVTVPMIAPVGEPKIVELRLLASARDAATALTTVGPAGTPVAGNADLQPDAAQIQTLQWVNAGFDYFGAPPCGDAGALTSWDSGAGAPRVVNAPPGTARVVQLALQQVGKPYVWGAKGPEQFDCSGLMQWAYGQIGIAIPAGTGGQWPGLKPVAVEALQNGDLAYFDTAGAGRVTHVGMVADVDGDGKFDLLRAAAPGLGVRLEYDMFGVSYYRSRVLGFRTMR